MDPSDFSCKWLDKKEIWRVAEEKRKIYWPRGTVPIDVEEIIELGLGLTIEPRHGLLQEADIDAFLKVDLSGFIVDYDIYEKDKFENRRRFSYAHELGHFFLHKYMYNEMRFDALDNWKRFILNSSEEEYGAFEFQANEFAGRFLVPREELIIEIDKALALLKKEGMPGLLNKSAYIVQPYLAASMQRKFGVSQDVIEKRLEREGLWPPKK